MTALELASKITHAHDLASQLELLKLKSQIEHGANLDGLAVALDERIQEMLYQVVKPDVINVAEPSES